MREPQLSKGALTHIVSQQSEIFRKKAFFSRSVNSYICTYVNCHRLNIIHPVMIHWNFKYWSNKDKMGRFIAIIKLLDTQKEEKRKKKQIERKEFAYVYTC